MAPTRIEPAATLLDWTISKGDDYSVRFPVLDAVNQAVTVTGWTAKAQVRRSDVEPCCTSGPPKASTRTRRPTVTAWCWSWSER